MTPETQDAVPQEAVRRPRKVRHSLALRWRWFWRNVFSRLSSSLTRRIVVLNLGGLVALLIGFLYFNQFRAGLIDARVQTLVGAGLYEFGDVDGLPAVARLQHPMDVSVDPNGQILWTVDTYNNKLKALSLRGGGAKSINLPYKFHQPAGIACLPGKLFIANTGAHEVVRIDTSNGQVTRLPIAE